jgi:hypothetical protein
MALSVKLTIPSHGDQIESPHVYDRANEIYKTMPHDSLDDRIRELEKRLGEIYQLGDDANYYLGQLTCTGSEINCPRCEAHKKIHKIKTLSDLTRRDVIIDGKHNSDAPLND